MKIAHVAEEFAALLRRGMSPVTDNPDVLRAFGFERAYPQVPEGYESTIWERSVEHHRSAGGLRVLVRERAYLVEMGGIS